MAGGQGDDRELDGWMASRTLWTWVWVGSRSWWWTGKPGMLQSRGLQRVGHNWVTELNWTEHQSDARTEESTGDCRDSRKLSMTVCSVAVFGSLARVQISEYCCRETLPGPQADAPEQQLLWHQETATPSGFIHWNSPVSSENQTHLALNPNPDSC